MKKRFVSLCLAGCLAAGLLTGCGGKEEVKETVDLNSLTLEEIVAKAKEEGKMESVGMPDTWANWGETWTEYTAYRHGYVFRRRNCSV